VFVGFGALIAVRSAGASDAFEVGYMRGVVSMGLLVVLAALAPMTFAIYPIGDQQVWVFSSVVVGVGILGSFVALSRSPEMADIDMELPRRVEVVTRAVWVIWLIAVMLIPIVIVLGLAPDLDAALYTTVVVLLLLWDAVLLLQLVFRRRPARA